MPVNFALDPTTSKLLSWRQIIKERKGRKRASDVPGLGKKDVSGALAEVGTAASSPERIDCASAYALIDGILSSISPKPSTYHISLSLEVLELLLKFTTEDPNLDTTFFTLDFLLRINKILQAIWDAAPVAKIRSNLAALLTLSQVLQLPLLDHLKLYMHTANWAEKRTAIILDILLDFESSISAFAFVVFPDEEESDSIATGVFRRLVRGLAQRDEIALIMGVLAVRWIDKVDSTQSAEEYFWISPILEALKTAKGRSNLRRYCLPGIFKDHPERLQKLLETTHYLASDSLDGSLEEVMVIFETGHLLGLVDTGAVHQTTAGSLIQLPHQLLQTALTHSSSSVRSSAFTILVTSKSRLADVPASFFDLLRIYYASAMGDEEGAIREVSLSLTSKLFMRLKDSSAKAHQQQRADYVRMVENFLSWFAATSLESLNPARPARIRQNAVQFLGLLLDSRIDSRYISRCSPSPSVPSVSSKSSPSAAWPFSLDLVNPSSTFVLLRVLVSTYTAVRAKAMSILESFPSPLPGYEGAAGDLRAQEELLRPALQMITSGREADASAGAEIVGLVWKKWICDAGLDWSLAVIGGWKFVQSMADPYWAFFDDLIKLANTEVDAFMANIARASVTHPMHGTLLTLQHLFHRIPLSTTCDPKSTKRLRSLFLQVLTLVERVWTATAIVLAANPSNTGRVDTEEARAIAVNNGDLDTLNTAENADGTGGPAGKTILSSSWRAMKQAGELLEVILLWPSEIDPTSLSTMWTANDIQHIGLLFQDWLIKIRHRGGWSAMYTSYTRITLVLVRQASPELQQLPSLWLAANLDALVDGEKVSVTRKSAGVGYRILSGLLAVESTKSSTFQSAMGRLFDIAESHTADIQDVDRVHSMNTLQAIFLDKKATTAPYFERGFLLCISCFYSANWICRNASMMLFGSLVTKSIGNRQINIRREAQLTSRISLSAFFNQYPSLHKALLSSLELLLSEPDKELATSDTYLTGMFSILLLISLLKTVNDLDLVVATTFLPFVQQCGESCIGKIRDAAGDAMSALVLPSQAIQQCCFLMGSSCSRTENSLHGRLLQVLRIVQAHGALSQAEFTLLGGALEEAASIYLDETHSFVLKSAFLDIVCCVGSDSQLLTVRATQILNDSRKWTDRIYNLPGASTLLQAAYQILIQRSPESTPLLSAGLSSPFLLLQRKSIARLDKVNATILETMLQSLFILIQCRSSSTELRILGINLVLKCSLKELKSPIALLESLMDEHRTTLIEPLRLALLPLILRLRNQDKHSRNVEEEQIFNVVLKASLSDNSFESRITATQALSEVTQSQLTQQPCLRTLLHLLQDDDLTIRQLASTVLGSSWNKGKTLSLLSACDAVLELAGLSVSAEFPSELGADLEAAANPSHLFNVEPSNIYIDPLYETDYMISHASISVNIQTQTLRDAICTFRDAVQSVDLATPLGTSSNSLVCKWAYRIVALYDRQSDEQVEEFDTFITKLRYLNAGEVGAAQ